MPSRSVRSAAAFALAASVTSFAYVGSAAPARAAGYDGYCRTSSGVTVVVDFRNLGGGVAIRCSPVGSGATGQQALQAAGIPVTEPTRTPGFVCRLYGKPSAAATLPGGYHEQCVNTPPTNAHWQYYQASNGGSWVSSSSGYATSQVISGGFEGWSFTEGSTNYAPSVAPSRPAASPQPPPASTTTQPPATRHTTSAPGRPRTTAPQGSSKAGAGAGGSTTKSATASKTAKKKAPSASPSSSTKAKHGKASSSSSAAAATGTSSGGPTNVAGGQAVNSDNLIKDSKKSSSINATTVVGGGVLGALAIGGGVVAIIRRRNLG